MTASTIRLVRDDTKPPIVITLTDDRTGKPIDLSSSTVNVVVMFRVSGDETAVATPISTHKINNGVSGQVYFDFSGGELMGIEPGTYEGEVKILNSADNSSETVFEVVRFIVRENF